jgi:hypothetical protein
MGRIHQNQPSGQLGIEIGESADRQPAEGMSGKHVWRLDIGLAQSIPQLDGNRLRVPRPAAAPAPAEAGTVISNASDRWSKLLLNPIPVR